MMIKGSAEMESVMEERERTRVVVDETTVYEIDLDCCECMEDVQERTDRAETAAGE